MWREEGRRERERERGRERELIKYKAITYRQVGDLVTIAKVPIHVVCI